GVPVHQLLGGAFRRRVRMYADCHGGHALESLGPLLMRRPARWADSRGQQPAGTYFDADATADAAGYTPEAYAAAARGAVASGFTALKFDLDVPTLGMEPDAHARLLGPAQHDHLVSLVEAVMDAVPRTIEVAFDCHWRFALR